MRIFLFCAKILHFHKSTKYSHKNDFRAAATDHDTATRIELKSHQKQRGLPRCYTPPGKATLKYRSLNCLGFDIRGIGHRKFRVGFFAKFLA